MSNQPICIFIRSFLPEVGRAYLAALSVEERSYLLDAIRAENKDIWLLSRELDRAFKDFQNYGYCFSIGDWQKDVNSVAVPYFHHQHGLLVFNCGGPSFLLNREKLEEDIAPRLLHMVNNIRSETS